MTLPNTEQPADTSLDEILWPLLSTAVLDDRHGRATTKTTRKLVEEARQAILSWHKSQTTALLKRVREEVLGEVKEHTEACRLEPFHHACICGIGDNRLKAEQRKALDNLMEELR